MRCGTDRRLAIERFSIRQLRGGLHLMGAGGGQFDTSVSRQQTSHKQSSYWQQASSKVSNRGAAAAITRPISSRVISALLLPAAGFTTTASDA